MFKRLYVVTHYSPGYSSSIDLVINTSQIASIELYDSTPNLIFHKDKEKYSKIFDTNDLSIFDITLSTGKDYLIIGPTKAYANIK